MNLYELTNDLKELESIVDDMEQVEAIKDIIKQEIANKGDNIIKLIKNIESDITTIENEVKRLQELKKVKQNKIMNIKNYTLECLKQADIKKVEGAVGRISVRKNAPSVILSDDFNNEKYIKIEEIAKIDKNAIKEDLKNGIVIEGASLEAKDSITIK